MDDDKLDHQRASTHKSQIMIDRMKDAQVPVPWCDEYERMISGMPYQSGKSEVMLQHKLKVARLLLEFNDTAIPDDATYVSLQQRRSMIGKNIFGKFGMNSYVEAPAFCVWGCNISIGDNVFVNRNVTIFDSGPIQIGSNTLIGPNVTIVTDNHGTDILARRAYFGFARPVAIGEDCWIGADVVILPGVRIGNGCTVGAGAVVNRDIPDYTVAVGSPARVVGKVQIPEFA